jgi:signal transduction histidine kinase
MDKSQIIFAICFVSFLLILLIGFLFFILLWQRRKSNSFIKERELMQSLFNEQLLQSQLEMQEHTFNSISHEIHDNVGQVLSLAKVQLNIMEQSDSMNKTILTEAKESVSKALADLRDIAKSLNSERVQSSTLQEITGHELQRIMRSGIMLTSVQVEGEVQVMPEQKKLIIFRIIQEALQNILKHSKAKNIDVIFQYETDRLKVVIADDGTGFDKELLIGKDGLGLQNIMNRAALIGGEAGINSIINKGTTVTIIAPYA